METQDLACTLASDELVQRIQDWRAVAVHAKSRTVTDSGVVSIYPLDSKVTSELQRLIEAEKDCCSFMDFEMTEAEGNLVVELRVPPDMKHVLALMLGLTTT